MILALHEATRAKQNGRRLAGLSKFDPGEDGETPNMKMGD